MLHVSQNVNKYKKEYHKIWWIINENTGLFLSWKFNASAFSNVIRRAWDIGRTNITHPVPSLFSLLINSWWFGIVHVSHKSRHTTSRLVEQKKKKNQKIKWKNCTQKKERKKNTPSVKRKSKLCNKYFSHFVP